MATRRAGAVAHHPTVRLLSVGMEKDYPPDLFDGVPRPPTVVREDRTMFADHEGTVYVEHGATLTLTGTLRGTLSVDRGRRR